MKYPRQSFGKLLGVVRKMFPVLLVLLSYWGGDVWALAGKSRLPNGSLIQLSPFVTDGLRRPVYLTHAGDGSGRLFVVEQSGQIRVITQGRLLAGPFLDLTSRVDFGGERGLLGLAFHPRYRDNGKFFVNYSRKSDGATVVAAYTVSQEPDRALKNGRTILVVRQPYGNHNGGMVVFGPDGFLYIGMGDGGAAGDPEHRGQNRRDLLGKLLRIDVDREKPYVIPEDNPFQGRGERGEIYAEGLRNPWRFSFDRRTGRLWLADVGQNEWEEVNVIRRGGNYGWRIMEGTHCFSPSTGCRHDGLTPPVIEYPHQGGRCSITGGYVYRGQAIPNMQGTYLFADYCSGEIFGVHVGEETTPQVISDPHVILSTDFNISSFGEGPDGELYVVGHGGGVYNIINGSERN